MDRSFWLSLLLFSLPVTESKGKDQSCLTQPNKVIWRKSGQSVDLPCTMSSHCLTTGVHYEWFSFKENSHLRLNLRNHLKYSLDGTSLHIKSLHANDSGIYHCAAALHGEATQGRQHVALGTTLVVREKVKVMVKDILLWSSFVLLALYSLALVTLIIKKNGCSMSSRMPKTSKSEITAFS
ncbi:uncharacterized protein si:ch211-139g16.8 isoform X2 [Notolabrus celidotus]|uniref:uncharacterized protein si:ch211-139g16.8 isoform X2 n=1 Tax=Notolabrus celidotus TaxID=1203425 RepID=UPI0014908354|nr:uncharacterized protein si:ch211-139g16.8 isoform X2 [Notolabrus celidotus]